MTIQTSHFHKIIRYVISNNLLPISFSDHYGKSQRTLDFYSYGVMKEKLSHKIVQSFSVCDPCFFTSFRDACLSKRDSIFDDLLSDYIKPLCEKGKYISMIIAECSVELRNTNINGEDKAIIKTIQQFLVNCLFVAGCNTFFHYGFTLSSPDRYHYRMTGVYDNNNVNLQHIFA
ncbi:hypothetical protein EIN_409940 [Entamoeba invadens IP1]|uniref:Uncharacterized protein n=1 Tax=Entamoeba invadens IP1 TaxID=370355 RepID=A0A0A1TZQ9_ENTIV|nr:hypothetical protein EIN_409940 [Entamoeba invadens IP1]ELP85675.1 hypothetical protein EIN_409940 [Entamoeba invadens IP1]|eukprot:XP_004185021.1 hypothetical protein EIN_409940 [Entamoeba invadens IP1]